jgi:hypothetical protein
MPAPIAPPSVVFGSSPPIFFTWPCARASTLLCARVVAHSASTAPVAPARIRASSPRSGKFGFAHELS